MSDDIEKVGLEEDATDAIAERTAALVSPDVAELKATLEAQAKSLADLLELANTPARTEIEPKAGEPAQKPGEKPVIYGGWDKFSHLDLPELGIVKTLVEGARRHPSARLQEVLMGKAEEMSKAGPTRVSDPFVAKSYMQYWADAMRSKAMTSTADGSGDDWVPTLMSAELWRDIHLATSITAAIRRVDMPSNPYQLPTETADLVFKYKSTENTAVTATNPTTSAATLTAVRIQAEVDFSDEVNEDSIIPIVPTLRADLVRKAAQTMDDLIVHGDTETGGTGNINKDEGAPTSGDYFLAMNGLRKFAVVTNSGQTSNVNAALSSSTFLGIRKLLGKYGAQPSDLFVVTGPTTHNAMLAIAEVITPDKYGSGATVLQGELGRYFGIPILMSEAIPLQTGDMVAADGKYSNSTAENTTGWIILANRRMWTAGFRRELTVESWKDIQKGQNILVAWFRMALASNDAATTHTAAGRNITV